MNFIGFLIFLSIANEGEEKNKGITEKFIIYCPQIIHPGLQELEYKDFFHRCRMDMILFDLEKKNGASFLLIDEIKNHFLSLVGIGQFYGFLLLFNK